MAESGSLQAEECWCLTRSIWPRESNRTDISGPKLKELAWNSVKAAVFS